MNDMSSVIVPKSDQLNSDDFYAGPRTITITGVKISAGTEQPVTINYEGDGGKPWKPCKSTSRVLVAAWGPDASKYVGRSATLYRDPTVKWAGLEVGGIRISHLSHIDRDMVLALTASKGARKPVTIRPLKADAKPTTPNPITAASDLASRLGQYEDGKKLWADWLAIRAPLKEADTDIHDKTLAMVTARGKELSVQSDQTEDKEIGQ